MELDRINFWKRLESFISNVQVSDMPSEEEKEMILHICKTFPNTQTFKLEEDQQKKLKEWMDSLPKAKNATIGGAYSYEFNPTGIGLSLIVKRVDGHEIDLTEYNKW